MSEHGGESLNEPSLQGETWHQWQSQSWQLPMLEIDNLLDRQRRFLGMLADSDIFYSRTDLRMFIDKCKTEARTKIMELYSQTCHETDEELSKDLVLHAAAKIMVSPLNIALLIKDYPDFICQTYPEDPRGSMPLHFAAAAVGSDHLGRLRGFIRAYPAAIEHIDECGMLPMQIALVHGADFDVMKLLIEAYPAAIERVDNRGMVPMQIALIHGADIDVMRLLIEVYPPALDQPLHLRHPVSEDLEPLVGLLPFHIACCRNCSLDVIFQLLVESPDCVSGANVIEK
mmetsp:Transcript_34907/g.75367  ORF Transcript_34907/g.75367 Transcript_34907/m.75367 type:complete len:286 (+) Transcript_34907:67-924(+)